MGELADQILLFEQILKAAGMKNRSPQKEIWRRMLCDSLYPFSFPGMELVKNFGQHAL